MKKSVLFCAMGLAAVSAVQAQEVGRVISSTPVIQQVAVPRQVCNQQPVAIQQPNSGAGGVMGAIAGGAMGNAIGNGNGRAAATVLGLIGGAMLGNQIEGSGSQVQNVQQCSTQTFYENRAVGYNVTYEYAGRQYTVQMPQDPGPTVRLQVTPVGASSSAPSDYSNSYGNPSTVQPAVVAPAQVQTYISAPPATVVYPAYYPGYYPGYYRPYYPPVSLYLGFGGGHRHHWR